MKISIIIPTLNEAAGLEQCLVRAWAAGPAEVVVVDGGSQDGTAELARRWGCRVFHSERGRAIQQNRGARGAAGDVLLFLHADSWLPPDGLDQIQTALANPRIAGGAFRQRIDAEGILYRILERGNSLRARVLRMAYGDQGIFVRQSVFWRIGGFPEVGVMEDVLLMRKLRRHTPVALLRGPLEVSARRWKRSGPIRQTARNWMITAAELVGVSPNELARYYPTHCDGWKNGN